MKVSILNKYVFNMKSIIAILFYFLIFTLPISAGDPDSTHVQRKWFVPDMIKSQFAGNIGFVSAGVGYYYAKNKMELDIMYGYVPESAGGKLHSLTLKNTWVPLRSVAVGKKLNFDLITAGIPLTYTFGNQFFTLPPRDKYPSNYYNHSTALRIGIFAGGRINYEFGEGKTIHSAGLYYEVGT